MPLAGQRVPTWRSADAAHALSPATLMMAPLSTWPVPTRLQRSVSILLFTSARAAGVAMRPDEECRGGGWADIYLLST